MSQSAILQTQGSDVYSQLKSVVSISGVTSRNWHSMLGTTVPSTHSAEKQSVFTLSMFHVLVVILEQLTFTGGLSKDPEVTEA